MASLICSLGDHKIPNYNKTTFTIDHQKQQQANRGILPSETLNAMDYLVDRLNASSGQIPATAAAVMPTATTGTAPSLRSDAIINSGAAESASRHGGGERCWGRRIGRSRGRWQRTGEEGDRCRSPHVQPLHPLLSPLRMGDHIRTVAATYDNCTLVHVHGPARSYVRDAPGGERRRDAERRASAVEGIVGAGC